MIELAEYLLSLPCPAGPDMVIDSNILKLTHLSLGHLVAECSAVKRDQLYSIVGV